MINFSIEKKPKRVTAQTFIPIDMAAQIKIIGSGNMSSGLRIILESVKEDIERTAKEKKKKKAA